MEKKRLMSIFEKMLLVVGFLVLIIGYFFINRVFIAEGYNVSWGFLQTVFLWLLMVIFIILLAIGEDIKEGILLEQLDEIKKLKEAFLKLPSIVRLSNKLGKTLLSVDEAVACVYKNQIPAKRLRE